ncbi:MAG TPA: tyrosine-type recombinase/integrase [Rugosimonospora sp.]|nr:tyrosine-type recombinase/integrase [Rugosimonospora sp.]
MVVGLPARLREALDGYTAALDGSTLSASTRRVYRSRVAGYLAYLAGRRQPAAALRDPHARNEAVAGYQAHLRERGQATAAVNAALVAVDHFYRHLGLGDAVVARDSVVASPPAALPRSARRVVVAPAATAGSPVAVRDLAVLTTAFYTGSAGAVVAVLDVDDVDLDGAVLRLPVRSVPVPPDLVRLLRRWLRVRAQWPPVGGCSALFLNRFGGRLGARSVTEVIARSGDGIGVRVSSAVLRATFADVLREAGAADEVVAVLTGRGRLGAAADASALRAVLRRASRLL